MCVLKKEKKETDEIDDITKLKVDMIVNAANQSLLGGGGVDGAIHNAAGPELYKECKTLGGAKTGETKVTKGYNVSSPIDTGNVADNQLPAKAIAHTVGPVYRAYSESEAADKLQSCYQSCLERCVEAGGGSLAFCCISTGACEFLRLRS
jgi:O-acetyl-ADP-ribose deacetylase (regulator of RNase III)